MTLPAATRFVFVSPWNFKLSSRIWNVTLPRSWLTPPESPTRAGITASSSLAEELPWNPAPLSSSPASSDSLAQCTYSQQAASTAQLPALRPPLRRNITGSIASSSPRVRTSEGGSGECESVSFVPESFFDVEKTGVC
jgi:hypothetical protein